MAICSDIKCIYVGVKDDIVSRKSQRRTLKSYSLLPGVDGGSVKDTLASVVVEAVMVDVMGELEPSL